MDLIDQFREIAVRLSKQRDHIQTEEATKTALVMPFINALGYNVFNPREVIPEFAADIGTKKGEKVDYAIAKDETIIMLIECKSVDCDLDQEHAAQLYRYFSVTEARFGILTNGILYRFYSDIEEPNKMDRKPFFEFNLLDIEDHQVEEIKKFTKAAFELDYILSSASTLKYTRTIKQLFASEIVSPSDAFVRFFTSRVYSGKFTQSVRDQFSAIVKNALNQFLRERVNDRLKSALEREEAEEHREAVDPLTEQPEEEPRIVTTQEEIDGYNIVRAILCDSVAVNRIVMRDTKNYCRVLLDDTNRKPLCRLHFKSPTTKYLGLFTQKKETREPIAEVDEIFLYANRLKTTLYEYVEPDSIDSSKQDDAQ